MKEFIKVNLNDEGDIYVKDKKARDLIGSITLSKLDTPKDNSVASYQLMVDEKPIGDVINVPKDLVVQSGTVETVTVDGSPVSTFIKGDKYLDLVIANSENKHIYVLVSDLVGAYTLPVATDTILGGVKVDNSSTFATDDGVISAVGQKQFNGMGTVLMLEDNGEVVAMPEELIGEVFNNHTSSYNVASGGYSHAQNYNTTASGLNSSAMGHFTKATGDDTFSSGYSTQANGMQSASFGNYTQANGKQANSFGWGTIANGNQQIALGTFNVVDDESKFSVIVGNGESDESRSNAFAIDKNGLLYKGNSEVGIDIANLSTENEQIKSDLGDIQSVLEKVVG